MRDYWLTKDLLQAAGIVFMVLSLAGIGLALWLPKKWWGKLLAVMAVGVLIYILIYKAIRPGGNHQLMYHYDAVTATRALLMHALGISETTSPLVFSGFYASAEIGNASAWSRPHGVTEIPQPI